MDLRHPVRSLTWAMTRALEHDLKGVESPVANDLLRTQSFASIEGAARGEGLFGRDVHTDLVGW